MLSIKKKIRLKKEDSAFAYFVFEAYQDVMAYSTLEQPPGAAYRDLELLIAPDFYEDAVKALSALSMEIEWIEI